MDSNNRSAISSTGQDNRREYPRVSGAIVEYSLVNVTETKITAFMRDLSMGGVCVYVQEDLEVGTLLHLYIHVFGGEHPIIVKGEIVWKRASGYLNNINVGIKFVGLEEKNQKRLEAYIDYMDCDEPYHPVKEYREEGEKKVYYDSGELLCEVKVVNSKEEGLKKCYYRTGNILEEADMKKGKPHGRRRLYYQNGTVHLEQQYVDGKVTMTKRFDKNGQSILEEELIN